jgi:hypothetical protein
VTTVVACVFQAQPLVLLLKCGARAEVAAADVVAELDHMADKAAHTDGLLVQQADRTGYCVHVLAIAIAHIAVYAVAHQDSLLEFANATAA